jgi:hypothetical protein
MISRMRTGHVRVDQQFVEVVEAFSHDRDVTIGGGKGSGALKVKGTIFAMVRFFGMCDPVHAIDR